MSTARNPESYSGSSTTPFDNECAYDASSFREVPTGPPASRLASTDPGGLQARADGQRVEMRTHDGELARIVTAAKELVEAGLADRLPHCPRLNDGIRLPPQLDRPSRRPDLDQMHRRDPGCYAAFWSGTRDAHVGKGALGRGLVDKRLRVGATCISEADLQAYPDDPATGSALVAASANATEVPND